MLKVAALGVIVFCSQELPVLVTEDFENGADRWEFSDPEAWKIADGPKGKMLSLLEKTTPKTPHKSPAAIALLKEIRVGDFVLEADVQSTVKPYPQQDLCLIFGYQDNDHFYYSHLARKTDKANNQIFIVNGADRAMISLRTTAGTDLSDEWTHVKVVRKTADGTIEIYWDDMTMPAQTAQSRTFLRGRVGVGSYDDLGNFRHIVLRGTKAAGDPK
ncbi:MAG TPA: hypothetical protein VE981_11015 [Planctomycetota bacterium]|nr:hypothetical protein [Planctomycetota bacterium]